MKLELGGGAVRGGNRAGGVVGEGDEVAGVLPLAGGQHDQGVAAGEGGELGDEESRR